MAIEEVRILLSRETLAGWKLGGNRENAKSLPKGCGKTEDKRG
jgi:hypothetical protein